MPNMYLLFFLSRLRVEGRSKTPEIVLKYKADGHEGVDFPEKSLNDFCYPLGAESVQPKEVQASEVSLAGRRTLMPVQAS